jgi:hypothetical protein
MHVISKGIPPQHISVTRVVSFFMNRYANSFPMAYLHNWARKSFTLSNSWPTPLIMSSQNTIGLSIPYWCSAVISESTYGLPESLKSSTGSLQKSCILVNSSFYKTFWNNTWNGCKITLCYQQEQGPADPECLVLWKHLQVGWQKQYRFQIQVGKP